MVQFLLIRVDFCIGLANAFGYNFRITFLVACVFAILALHSCRVFKKVPTKSTTHDIVELLEHEFVTVELVDLFLSLTYSALAIESNIKRSPVLDLFSWTRLVICSQQR